MIVQTPFQLVQQVSVNGALRGQSNDLTVRVPKNAVAWRIRPDAYGESIELEDMPELAAAGRLPLDLTLDGSPFTLDTTQWQTIAVKTIRVLTDAFIAAAVTDVQIPGTAEVFVAVNYILEYCTEQADLLLQCGEVFKTVPNAANLEALVQTTVGLIYGPVLGDAAQITLQNLGPNAVWLIVAGAYAGLQFNAGLPDPASKGQLLAPGGAYIYSRILPGMGIFGDCPGGNQVAGKGVRVVVVDA